MARTIRTESISNSAEVIVWLRAFFDISPHRELRYPDAYAARFLRRPLYRMMYQAARLSPTVWQLLYEGFHLVSGWSADYVSCRTRFIDDTMREAVGKEVRQLVILGAGFDTRTVRLFRQTTDKVHVLEVDRPPTLAARCDRLGTALHEVTTLRMVACDVTEDRLPRLLLEGGLDPAQPMLFLLEGLFMYLSNEEAVGLIRRLGLLASGSGPTIMIFTYLDAAAANRHAENSATKLVRRFMAGGRERFRSWFAPEEMAAALGSVGFVVRQDLSAADLVQRYRPTERIKSSTVMMRIGVAERSGGA